MCLQNHSQPFLYPDQQGGVAVSKRVSDEKIDRWLHARTALTVSFGCFSVIVDYGDTLTKDPFVCEHERNEMKVVEMCGYDQPQNIQWKFEKHG